MAGEERGGRVQNVILEGRKRLSVSGVKEVDGFDDTYVRMHTLLGELVVRGEGLHVELLSVETGDAVISGDLNEMSYEEPTEKRSFWSRLIG